MALPNARSQYLKTQVETASKEQLVVMLFDGIIRFTENARKAMQEEKLEESHNALMRAQAIVMELICTLDREKGGEVAGNLMSLHAYAFNCLIVCNMKKDISKIDEVQHIYRELREGWVGAMDRLGIGASAAAATGGPDKAAVGTSPAVAAKAPAAVASTSASALTQKPAAPARPSIGAGIMASAAAPAPAPAPAAAGYGMGRTAGLGLRPASTASPIPAAQVRPAAPAPATVPAAKPAASVPAAASASTARPAPAPVAAAAAAAKPAPITAKPATPAAAAMLSAYGKARSIA